MKKITFFLFILSIQVSGINNLLAQNTFPSTGKVGIGTTAPNASSLLEVKSTTKGILIPRMTLTQRNAIASPATGLFLYQTNSSPGFYYYNGTSWKAVTSVSKWITSGNNIYFNGGRVGIGTSTPAARLQVIDSSVVFSASSDANPNPGNTPFSGLGRRMMWYSDKAAFRVGFALSNEWDLPNIGYYSFASGNSTIASGLISTATGYHTTASGYSSFVAGYLTTASGDNSTAMGSLVTTNGKRGSFIIGDHGDGRDNTIYYSDVDNQMQMVFSGGYRLYTGTSASGVLMNGGDNSWSSISDSTKKEKKLIVNGEDVLNKISKFKLCTWNYKGQDATKFRHYGPMAQDFHNAFGKDRIGNIGNDTLINQQDFLGISFIAVQALEKRTEEIQQQQTQIDSLKAVNNALQQQLNGINARIALLENAMSQCCGSSSSNLQSDISNSSAVVATLDQNIPNPFTRASSIYYYIPSGFHSAQLVITDASGHALKTYSISSSGYGNLVIDGNEFAGGMYHYSLSVDGKTIATKKMILSK